MDFITSHMICKHIYHYLSTKASSWKIVILFEEWPAKPYIQINRPSVPEAKLQKSYKRKKSYSWRSLSANQRPNRRRRNASRAITSRLIPYRTILRVSNIIILTVTALHSELHFYSLGCLDS